MTGASLWGVEGLAVEVEVRISSQLPRVDIVGLPEAVVRESTARVRAALVAAGEKFPDRRVTVNLAPAGVRKSGPGLDLAIAIGILAAEAQVPAESLEGLACLGELALDGRLRPVRGALAMALAVQAAGAQRLCVSEASAPEAALAPGLEVRGAADLRSVLAHLRGGDALPFAAPIAPAGVDGAPDVAEVRGQEHAKRALLIAAAGGHGLLLTGPPGTGKTLLARRLPGLLPALDRDEQLEVTRIQGAAGVLAPSVGSAALVAARPFRAPHHAASRAGILGGGAPPRAGEVTLAHRGVLFLDELPEFERGTLESLRQVLEERRVRLARAHGTVVFPADFQLVAAANPCPCGHHGSPAHDCRCDDRSVERYRARISGPLLDRIALQVDVPAVPWETLRAEPSGPTSHDLRQEVARVRLLAATRLSRAHPELRGPSNARIPAGSLLRLAPLSRAAEHLLERTAAQRGLSARAIHGLLRVARTVADLRGEEKLGDHALAEALSLRAP